MNNNNGRQRKSLDRYQAHHLQELITEIIDCCQEKTLYQARKFNLTQAELKCILFFKEERYLTVKGLAQKLDVAKSRITKITDGLVRKKLAQRLDDPEDARVRLIGLTPEGQKQMENAARFLEDIHHQLLLDLRESERKNVLTALETLRASMEVIKGKLL